MSSKLEKSSVSIFTLIPSWKSRWFMKTDVQTDRREESFILLCNFFAKARRKDERKEESK